MPVPLATLPASDMQSTGFAVNKTTAHANTPHNGMPPAFSWFDQGADPGRMALGLPVGDSGSDHAPPGDAMACALLLARAEPLLSTLSVWWATPIDLGPCTGPGETPLCCELHIVDEALAPVGTRLRLPTACLPASPPPARLCHPHVQWPDTACTIDLDHLPAEVLGMLQPGGLVLLPRSLRQPWPVTARAVPTTTSAGPVSMAATLDLLDQALSPCIAPPRHTPDDVSVSPHPVHVRLDDTVAWPLDRLHGWGQTDAAAPRTLTHLRASLWLGAHCCARGCLVPAGDGQGLWIDTVSLPPQAIDILLDESAPAWT